MFHLVVLAEGQTERQFVNSVLRPFLGNDDFQLVHAKILGERGGIRNWDSASRDIVNTLKERSDSVVTTMVDFYGLPDGIERGWPGRRSADDRPFDQKLPHLHAEIAAAVSAGMGANFDARRFVPNVLMHEFEALLFSDCARFAAAIGRPEIEPNLAAIRGQVPTPEHINDSVETAPSKRIQALIPRYQKPSQGLLAAQAIGLETMRRECPYFSAWLDRLVSARQSLA